MGDQEFPPLSDIPVDVLNSAREIAASRYAGEHWRHMRTHILGGLYDADPSVHCAAVAIISERRRAYEIHSRISADLRHWDKTRIASAKAAEEIMKGDA